MQSERLYILVFAERFDLQSALWYRLMFSAMCTGNEDEVYRPHQTVSRIPNCSFFFHSATFLRKLLSHQDFCISHIHYFLLETLNFCAVSEASLAFSEQPLAALSLGKYRSSIIISSLCLISSIHFSLIISSWFQV